MRKVICAVLVINFVILFSYKASIKSTEYDKDQGDHARGSKAKLETLANLKKRQNISNHHAKYCVPHSYLVKRYGLPGPCDYKHVILDCTDPHLGFLHDPHVLASCGLNNSFKTAELRDQMKRADKNGWNNCTKVKGVLVSKNSVPVQESSSAEVPNIVHYVSLGCHRTFTFPNFLSVLSVHRFIKPRRIYFHGDCLPQGPWWNETVLQIPNIYFRERGRTKLIQGVRPMWIEHETDIIRLQILYDDGGVYLDTDVLVLSPLTDLLRYEVTLGREEKNSNKALGSSFILTKPKTPFVCLWLYAFREYAPTIGDWSKYAILAPGKISLVFPQHVHVEKNRFFRPSWFEVDKIYSKFYDWSENYIIHLWNKAFKRDKNIKIKMPQSPSDIPEVGKMNCTLHEIFRYVYFNQKYVYARKRYH